MCSSFPFDTCNSGRRQIRPGARSCKPLIFWDCEGSRFIYFITYGNHRCLFMAGSSFIVVGFSLASQNGCKECRTCPADILTPRIRDCTVNSIAHMPWVPDSGVRWRIRNTNKTRLFVSGGDLSRSQNQLVLFPVKGSPSQDVRIQLLCSSLPFSITWRSMPELFILHYFTRYVSSKIPGSRILLIFTFSGRERLNTFASRI